MKSALNLDLTLSDDGECLALLISCGIIDLGAFCVELWSFYVSKRISVPMSYISFWEHCLFDVGSGRKKIDKNQALEPSRAAALALGGPAGRCRHPGSPPGPPPGFSCEVP